MFAAVVARIDVGRGGSGDNMVTQTGFDSVARREGLVTVYPYGSNRLFGDEPALEFTLPTLIINGADDYELRADIESLGMCARQLRFVSHRRMRMLNKL